MYDPANLKVARERFRVTEVVLAVLFLLVGIVVAVSGIATLVLAVIVFV